MPATTIFLWERRRTLFDTIIPLLSELPARLRPVSDWPTLVDALPGSPFPIILAEWPLVRPHLVPFFESLDGLESVIGFVTSRELMHSIKPIFEFESICWLPPRSSRDAWKACLARWIACQQDRFWRAGLCKNQHF
jgi:hypothetical protein